MHHFLSITGIFRLVFDNIINDINDNCLRARRRTALWFYEELTLPSRCLRRENLFSFFKTCFSEHLLEPLMKKAFSSSFRHRIDGPGRALALSLIALGFIRFRSIFVPFSFVGLRPYDTNRSPPQMTSQLSLVDSAKWVPKWTWREKILIRPPHLPPPIEVAPSWNEADESSAADLVIGSLR